MNGFDTPILMLIFNRPETTIKVFEAIREVKPKYLFVAADGPRMNRIDEYERCMEARRIFENIDWDCKINTLFRDENLGCGAAVSSAITWFFNNVDEGIVLEDDCLPNKSFFTYCSTLLEYYRFNDQIMFISGDSALSQNFSQNSENSYFFSAIPRVWGWASWRRSWEKYLFDVNRIDNRIFNEKLDQYFEDLSIKNFWKKIRLFLMYNLLDTWDYQLGFSLWVNNGLAITPYTNMVSNIGFGINATHTINATESTRSNLQTYALSDIIHPKEIKQDKSLDMEMLRFEYKSVTSFELVLLKLKLWMRKMFFLSLK